MKMKMDSDAGRLLSQFEGLREGCKALAETNALVAILGPSEDVKATAERRARYYEAKSNTWHEAVAQLHIFFKECPHLCGRLNPVVKERSPEGKG